MDGSQAVAPRRVIAVKVAVIVMFVLAAGAYLYVTPPGLLDKIDALGYAVCHRIDSHSYFIAGRQLPLCARCTGIFQSAAITLIALIAAGRGRCSAFPPRRVIAVLALFMLAMGIDGLNSYLGFFHGLLPQAYTPANWLRLATGTLDGVVMAALTLPLFSFTFWREPDPRPAIRSLRELAGLALLAALGGGLVLTGLPALLVPLAVLGTAGEVALLAAVNTTIVLLLTRQENRVTGLHTAVWPLLAGLAVTLAMIAGIDAVRFALTGTWGGLPM